jgi:tetratricopeptide (TPR) repeat protein
VHLTLARLRQRRRDTQGVIDQLLPLYQPCPEQGPLVETLELPLLLLQTLQQEKRHAEALALIEPLLQRWSSSLSLQHCALELLLARGEAARASQVLQVGLAQHPRDAVLHRLQGQLCLQLADPDSAVQALQQALALDPTDATTAEQLDAARQQQLWQRGEQALRQASWHEAEQAYRQLLERDPHQSDALRRLDLLASLNSDQLGTMNSTIDSSAGSDAQVERLLAFQHNLDRIEAQLKMLGCSF